MIKAIIFDCFGVLTADAWHAFRLSLPQPAQTEAQDLMHQYSGGFIEKSEFVQGVAAATGHEAHEIETLLEAGKSKNLPLLDYIRELRGKGYKIGLLSNIASNWIRDSFLTADEQAMFDQMIFSYEVGMTKPDPRIFHLACDQLGVASDEAILIDDIGSYCNAAAGEGMTTIIYSTFPEFRAEIEKILYHK